MVIAGLIKKFTRFITPTAVMPLNLIHSLHPTISSLAFGQLQELTGHIFYIILTCTTPKRRLRKSANVRCPECRDGTWLVTMVSERAPLPLANLIFTLQNLGQRLPPSPRGTLGEEAGS